MQPSNCPGVSVLRLTITAWSGRTHLCSLKRRTLALWRHTKSWQPPADWSYGETTQKTTTDISTAVRTSHLCCVEEVCALIWSHRSKTLPHTNKREKEQKEEGQIEMGLRKYTRGWHRKKGGKERLTEQKYRTVVSEGVLLSRSIRKYGVQDRLPDANLVLPTSYYIHKLWLPGWRCLRGDNTATRLIIPCDN